MADINVEMLKEKLYKVASALFRIGETCVDVSKQHISEEDALNKIRDYLSDTDVICSRFRVDRLIEECMEPVVTNTFGEIDNEWLKKLLSERPIQTLEVNFPSCCDSCSNNPKNGGSGICNCTLPYMQNPIMYNVGTCIDDYCMTATTSTGAYIFGKEKPDADKQPKAGANRIADAVERTKPYMR